MFINCFIQSYRFIKTHNKYLVFFVRFYLTQSGLHPAIEGRRVFAELFLFMHFCPRSKWLPKVDKWWSFILIEFFRTKICFYKWRKNNFQKRNTQPTWVCNYFQLGTYYKNALLSNFSLFFFVFHNSLLNDIYFYHINYKIFLTMKSKLKKNE